MGDDAVAKLQRAGAHVGVFTETRIQSADRHHLIVNAFKSKGYLAISHNATTQRSTICTSPVDSEFGPRSAGVILVVSSCHISGWANVVLDPYGRAMAASLDSHDGSTIRIIGVYGVSGASCVNFLSFPSKPKAESFLNEFLLSQFKYCEQNGIHTVVAGDLNSYQKPELDHFGGPFGYQTGLYHVVLISSGVLRLVPAEASINRGFHSPFQRRWKQA